MAKTIIYIDVDGVINSFHQSFKGTGWSGDYRLKKIIGYKIRWYTDLVDSLNELAKREDVEVKWLTTWQDKAVTDLCPALGIEGQYWDVLYAADQEDLFDLSNGWWKLRAIIKDYTIHQPDKVVWIDDDIKYEGNALAWINHMEDTVHAVSPFTDWGMTKEEFSGIIEYINN
jgi:hypothetical protein